MLNEVLENSKKELIQIIQKSEALQKRKAELEEEMQQTKADIISLNQENRSLSVYRKRNPIIEFFMKTFSKKYKQELKDSASNSKELTKLNEKMTNLRSEKRKLDLDEQTLNPERAKGQLEKMENTDVAIHMLVNEKTELTKNPEFMKDLINRNMQYIEYDNSNEPELYMQYIEKMIQKLEEAKERNNANEFTINITINTAKKILEELNSPKEVEEGKYKIPRRFLFEGLRKSGKKDLELLEKGEMIDILSVGRDYLREDGCYKQEYGKKLEELYEDKDRFLVIHYINASYHFRAKDETMAIRDNIYKEGLHSSIQGMDCINTLDRTAHGTFEEDKSFMELMSPDHKMIIMLPKKALNKNSEEPIWGSDFPEADIQHPGYIFPEYIYGYINPDTEEIEENPISVENRKKYKYQFLNGQTTCVDDRVKY
ncbi:MAG: hypothetical protein ACLUG5_04250 [Clostridia bacterium]|mgnify:FL=1|jgi:hypothetical protein